MGIQGTPALRSPREACATSDSTNPSSAAFPAASRRCWLPPDVARSNPRSTRRWLAAMLLGAGSLLAAASQDAAAFATDACLVARGGAQCTANDGSISSVVLNPNPEPNTNPSSCNAGDQIDVDLLITLGPINANERQDIGVYIAKDGNPINNVAGQATSCSVFTSPVPAGPPPSTGTFPPPVSGTFSNLDGNACGDLQKDFGQGTPGNPAWIVKSGKISVKCVAGPGGTCWPFRAGFRIARTRAPATSRRRI